MHTRRLTAVLSAAAFTLTAAASASTVITLAEEYAPGKPTETCTQGMEETQETISAVTMDMSDFEEEQCSIELSEKTVNEKETVIYRKPASAEKTSERIRLAESRTIPSYSSSHVDVGNQKGGETAPEKFPFRQTTYSSNEQALWDFFKSMGFSDEGAAGAMGNLAMESGLDPASRSGNFDYAAGKGAAGLAGWLSSGRMKPLMAMAEANGVSWQDLSIQMAYIQYELENTRQNVGQRMKMETDVDMAADYFCVYYEGCIGRSAAPAIDGISSINGKWYQGLTKRKTMAKMYYERYSKK